MVSLVGRGEFGDLRVHVISAKVVVFDVASENRGVHRLVMSRIPLNGGCSTCDLLHLGVLECLRFKVPVVALLDERLAPCHFGLVTGVVLPLVSVRVELPPLQIVVPQWHVVVVQMIVRVH